MLYYANKKKLLIIIIIIIIKIAVFRIYVNVQEKFGDL